MIVLLRKMKPVWALAFLFVCTCGARAASGEPADALKAGMVAYEQGDYAAAIAQLQTPAAEGNRDALFYLGEAVAFHTARAGNLTQAYNVHKLGVDAGDRRAQFRLAEMLVTGVPAKKDVDGAFALLRKAASAEFVPATVALQQVYKARALAREWAMKITASDLGVQSTTDWGGVEGHLFGGGSQVLCANAHEAAVLSKVGNFLYDRFDDELLLSYYNTLPDGVLARPWVAAFYAHVINADKSLFPSCSISLGLPRDAVTSGRRIPAYELVEFKGAEESPSSSFWLLPNRLDTSGYRLGVQVGPSYFQSDVGELYGCPREASTQIILSGAAPDVLKQCVPLQVGMVAATGRSLKVSKPDEAGFVHSHLLPEVVVFGQFGAAYYLNRVGVEGVGK